MAKRTKTLPARKPRDRSRGDDSMLLRSAESLGRVIGVLQRQLDEATKRLATAGPNGKATTRTRAPRKKKATAARSRKVAKKR